MDDADRQAGAEHADSAASDAPGVDPSQPEFDESLIEEMGALIDDGRTYAEAELAFQKTRAKLAGKLVGVSLLLVIVALILLHIAFLALAVGLVLAFEPLVGIWGAIAIVFGGLLLVVALLGWMAFSRAKTLGALFSAPDDGGEA